MLSVIICTYNPSIIYLNKTLDALKSQTLAQEYWELIIVDNNSSNNFLEKIDTSWHSNIKIVLEERQGLTSARIAGINNSLGEYIIFVDDDNLLENDYLEEALNISKKWPLLGAFGGNIEGLSETPPENWTKEYWYYLAIRSTDKDYWSNDFNASKAEPCGAGLCIKKEVGLRYVTELNDNTLRQRLDRVGTSLISGGDTDIVLTALDMNLGMGVFKSLRMRHIIPKERITEGYLLRLMEGLKYSHIILSKFRKNPKETYEHSMLDKIRNSYYLLKLRGRDRKFYKAKVDGEIKAYQFIKRNNL
ncbi:MAG: glycosyltransferase [Heyndrickxia sp.]